jgi:signal transduction histidine kinase
VHGTGLGLAMVHDIVTSAGGLIHVDSARGSGTCITVLLPLVPEAARAKIEGEHLQGEEKESIL